MKNRFIPVNPRFTTSMLGIRSRHILPTYDSAAKEYFQTVPLDIKCLIYSITYMSRVVINMDFCLFENKGTDQLRSNCEADQRLCFRYMDSTISLLKSLKWNASSLLL